MKKNIAKRGFTLIELMVSMVIFVIFTGIMITSYASIVRGQKQADQYRILYSEGRRVFDQISEEVLNGGIAYEAYEGTVNPQYRAALKQLDVVSKDGGSLASFVYDEREQSVLFSDGGGEITSLVSSEDVVVQDLHFFVSPAADPYNSENTFDDALQFQPKVTIFGRFALRDDEDVEVFLQTTISSRFYSQTPTVNFINQ